MSGSTTTSRSVRFTSSLCERYVLPRTDFEDWAVIFVYHNEQGLEIVIRTDFGTYDYAWWNVGAGPWHEFLAEIGTNYAMSKFRPLMTKRQRDYPQFLAFRDRVWPRVQALFKEINDKSQPS